MRPLALYFIIWFGFTCNAQTENFSNHKLIATQKPSLDSENNKYKIKQGKEIQVTLTNGQTLSGKIYITTKYNLNISDTSVHVDDILIVQKRRFPAVSLLVISLSPIFIVAGKNRVEHAKSDSKVGTAFGILFGYTIFAGGTYQFINSVASVKENKNLSFRSTNYTFTLE